MNKKNYYLIVDAYSVFVRHYKANPAISSNGEHVGAIIGFLKTLERVVDKYCPESVYIVWEGGGSTRKRGIFSDYKSKRKPFKMNKFFEEEIVDTNASRNRQIVSLISLLKELPVQQIYVPDCEADDIIGYMCKYLFRNENKLVLSSDQDYYQLLDENTFVCTVKRNQLISKDYILKEYGISTNNFCIAKAICGDRSDNIKGIKGAGYKTVAKRFPALSDERSDVILSDILNHSKKMIDSKVKLYERIVGDFDLVKRNWKLMYLDTHNLSSSQIARAERFVNTFQPSGNKIGFIRKIIAEGLLTLDVDRFFLSMRRLIVGN